MSTMNISLPDEMTNWVENEIKQGGFASASEFFRHLVREAKARREIEARTITSDSHLEALLLEGLESEGEPVTAQWWANLRAEANKELKKRGATPIDWESGA